MSAPMKATPKAAFADRLIIGDAHEHAAHVGDQPDCPHGDASHGRSIPSSLLEPSGEIRSHCRCLGGVAMNNKTPLFTPRGLPRQAGRPR